MDAATDWRISLQPENRRMLVAMIMETLKNCIPVTNPEGLVNLNRMAELFEEEVYTASMTMSDYLRNVSLKIQKIETKVENTASPGMQSQMWNQQKSQVPLLNQSQARKHMTPQNIQNTAKRARVQSSASLPFAPYVTSLSQTSLSKAVCQSNNTQSGIAQNSVGSSVSQGIPSNAFSSLHYLYQQQLQQPLHHQILSYSEAQARYGVMYQKIQTIKEMYLPSLNDMYQKLCLKCQQIDSCPKVSDSEAVERIKLGKNTFDRAIQILNVSKSNVAFAEKIASCEEEMISILSSNSTQNPISAQQQIRKPGDHPLSMQPQQQCEQQQLQLKPDNQMNHQMQPTNMQNSVSSKQSTVVTSTRHDSNAQRTQNAVDQQEEIYKKIQFMKKKYLPGLNDMYQNIFTKCEQHDSHLNVRNSERIERLKLIKNMLELAIGILNLSNNSIVPAVKLISIKKIQGIFRSTRPQIPVSAQQQVWQPGGHPVSTQPQQQQQHPVNQMQLTNIQNSVSSKQFVGVTSMRHASTDSEAQKGQTTVDWREETYQKIQGMKRYLPRLNDIYQQISINCQQNDLLPSVQTSEEMDRLKLQKNALEHVVLVLNVSKSNILPAWKKKMTAYEEVILQFLSKWPRKPDSEQPQQQPKPQQQQQQQQQHD